MTKPGSRPQRIYRRFTPEERARHAEIRKQVEAEKPELEAGAQESIDRYEAALLRYLRIQGAFDRKATIASLKSARQQQGLSLSELSERSGIDEPTLRELETDEDPRPTLRTLQRYAEAVGRRFVLGLIDAECDGGGNLAGDEVGERREAG